LISSSIARTRSFSALRAWCCMRVRAHGWDRRPVSHAYMFLARAAAVGSPRRSRNPRLNVDPWRQRLTCRADGRVRVVGLISPAPPSPPALVESIQVHAPGASFSQTFDIQGGRTRCRKAHTLPAISRRARSSAVAHHKSSSCFSEAQTAQAGTVALRSDTQPSKSGAGGDETEPRCFHLSTHAHAHARTHAHAHCTPQRHRPHPRTSRGART